ncbi:MAG: hypothetical protein ACK4UK_08300 [Flavobacterium sp.]
MIKTDKGKTVVLKGINDYIVVDTEKALLILPKSDEQEIKNIIKNIN